MRITAEGIQATRALLDAHAHNIANANAEGYASDLTTDVVGVIYASHAYAANAKVLEVMAKTEQSLLDVLA